MEAIIKEVYESNFGTAYETYKEAATTDNSIRLSRCERLFKQTR